MHAIENNREFSARLFSSSCPPARLQPVSGRRQLRLLCRAAQLLTDREMRGGDAGWGHKQGEAEEEKAERESPALEYTATTRRSERGRGAERLAVVLGGS